MHVYKAVLLGLGLALAIGAPARATVISGCTTYLTTNGTTSYPGTYVGTVGNGSGQVCQIGAGHNNSGPALITPTINPSIYSFYFDGGLLTITESVGNNGTLTSGWDVELASLATQTSTSPSSILASINIPYSSGPSGPFTLVSNMSLVAGYYAVDNYIGTILQDPMYQLNFTATPLVKAPEPASLALLGGALGAIGLLRRRRKSVD